MADRPILFSGPMVRALLAGTKTQTRRLMKPQPELQPNGLYHIHNAGGGVVNVAEEDVSQNAVDYLRIVVGDRLYVRERIERAGYGGEAVGYPADGSWLPNTPWEWKGKSLPSIHMPRRLSRITLTVTDVRVERLQEISEEDARAEGITRIGAEYIARGSTHWDDGPNFYTVDTGYGAMNDATAAAVYMRLWDRINGEGSSALNPWVAAYTFTVEHGNIDEVGK